MRWILIGFVLGLAAAKLANDLAEMFEEFDRIQEGDY